MKNRIGQLEDPRRTGRGHILHKLEDIIIGLCTLVCNGSDFRDMEDFGREREEWLRGFLALPNGVPDSDTFRRVFERLEEASRHRVGFMWLLGDSKAPDHTTLARFRTGRCREVAEDLFYQYIQKLEEMGEIDHQEVFIDGTKLESRGGRYTNVYRSGIMRWLQIDCPVSPYTPAAGAVSALGRR